MKKQKQTGESPSQSRGRDIHLIINNKNLITYIAQVFIKWSNAHYISNKSMKRKENKNKNKNKKTDEPIYNKQNKKKIYTSAIKI